MLRKLPAVPPPSQAAIAQMIATLVNQGIGPAALVLTMRFDAEGKKLLAHAATLDDPAELLRPLREDAASSAVLAKLDAAKLEAFAREFISEAKKAQQ